jgi:cytochrome c oxidase subunit 2
MPTAGAGDTRGRVRRAARAAWTRITPFAALMVLAGCDGAQSTLDPRGPVAQAIASLWWVLFWGAFAIFGGVMAALWYALRRRRDRPAPPVLVFLVGGGLVFPIVVLTALLVYGTAVGRLVTQPADSALQIEVTGHQWWWEVRYPAAAGFDEVLTANELRLPVGVPVVFAVRGADVIHSFWIPNLAGKVDMIPGRTNVLRLSAGEAGSFRAQCAEFCGTQHSRMGLLVVAEPPEAFAAWRRARAAPAARDPEPGLQRFEELGCGACHAIAGTTARGAGGPVLTHLGDRPTLGAATVANTPALLRHWLADHGQTLKPGSRGPSPRVLAPDDVETLATFLERLK